MCFNSLPFTPSLQSTFWRRFCPRWDVGVRGYSWKLECMTWSPPETSLVPLRFPNAKPFQLLINCDTLYGAKNVLAFVRKITKSRGQLIVAVPSRASFYIYLRSIRRTKRVGGRVRWRESENKVKNSIRRCPNKMSVLGKEAGRKMK